MPKCSASVRTSRAFTLIELLVVISIVALLVSILLPALGNAREVARKVQCAANVRSFGLAAFLYDNDWGQLPRPMVTNGNGLYGMTPEATTAMQDDYALGNTDWYKCPSGAWAWARPTKTMYLYYGGAGNTVGSDTIRGWHKNRLPGNNYNWYPQVSAANPDIHTSIETFMGEPNLGDSYWNGSDVGLSEYIGRPNHARNFIPAGTYRVSEGGNQLYLDGHVQWHAPVTGESWLVAMSARVRIYLTPGAPKPYPQAYVIP